MRGRWEGIWVFRFWSPVEWRVARLFAVKRVPRGITTKVEETSDSDRGRGRGRTVWKANGRLSYPGKGSQNGILWFPASTQTRLPFLSPFCRHSRWKGCFTGCHRLFNRPRMFCTNTKIDALSFTQTRWKFVDTLSWNLINTAVAVLRNTNSAINLNINIIYWENIWPIATTMMSTSFNIC